MLRFELLLFVHLMNSLTIIQSINIKYIPVMHWNTPFANNSTGNKSLSVLILQFSKNSIGPVPVITSTMIVFATV